MSKAERKRHVHMWQVLVGIFIFCCLLQIASGQNTSDPRKIMQGVYQQDDSRDTTLRAVFDVFDKDGHKQQKRFVLLRLGSPVDSRTLVRFTDPPELRGVTLLSLNHPGQGDRQWIYTPATDRVRSLAPRDRSERFAGTDFTYEDIAERALDDFVYRLINDNEAMDGHPAFKIAATPADPSRSQYKFIYYWVAQDVPCILFAEMYDLTGAKVRTLHGSQLKKVSGIWGARRTEVSSVLENTRTTLTIDEVHFNRGLAEEQFTPEGMKTADDLTKKR